MHLQNLLSFTFFDLFDGVKDPDFFFEELLNGCRMTERATLLLPFDDVAEQFLTHDRLLVSRTDLLVRYYDRLRTKNLIWDWEGEQNEKDILLRNFRWAYRHLQDLDVDPATVFVSFD